MAKGRFISGDEIEVTHDIRSSKGYGTVKARCYFDTPDHSVGYWGGWIMEECSFSGELNGRGFSTPRMDRASFEANFGFPALSDVEDAAAEEAYHKFVVEPTDRREEY